MHRDTPVVATVIIGSVTGGEAIHHLLEALCVQIGGVPFEVIVADRCEDGTAERILRDWPQVTVLRRRASTSLPELRTSAFEQSRGRFVLVTADHTIPSRCWVSRLVAGLQNAPVRIAAAGGPVENAACRRGVDWAAFLCEYSAYLPPQPAGETDDIPGMNIAYRREHLERAGHETLTRGFWESTLHPRLLADGHRFRRIPEAVMAHRKHFGLVNSLRQRFHYSRAFAGQRFEPTRRLRRFTYSVLAVALPALVLARIGRRVWRRRAYRYAFLRALPPMILFAIVWGLGEIFGYASGPGDSLAVIE